MITKNCKQCGKEIQKRPVESKLYFSKKTYCSLHCFSQTRHSYIPWNKNLKGIHQSPLTEFKQGQIGFWAYKKRLNMTGEKHFNWKGGISKERVKAYYSLKYQNWRKSIFEKNNYTCAWCKATSGNGKAVVLQADHIKPYAFYPILRFDTNNGQTLCKNCHLWKTKMDNKVWKGKVPELNIVFGSSF